MFKLLKAASARIGNVVLLPFSTFGKRTGSSGLVWLVHVVLVIVAVFGLAWLNQWWRLDMQVQAPSLLLRRLWLPLMFLVAYSMGWCLWWTWQIWKQPGTLSPFPDVFQAWGSAIDGLKDNGFDLSDRQVILLLGTTAASERATMKSLEIESTYGPHPSDPSTPVRVMADDRAIYISTPGLSSLSSQATKWYESESSNRRRRVSGRNVETISESNNCEMKMPAVLRGACKNTTAAPALQKTRSEVEIGASLQQAENQLASAIDSSEAWPTLEDFCEWESNSPASITISRQEGEASRQRLAYLASLVRESREGQVPFDSVVLFTPLEALKSSEATEIMSKLACADLDTLSLATGSVAPVVCVITDLDEVAGCDELISRLPQERRQLLLGTEMPVNFEEPSDPHQGFEKVAHIGNHIVPALCCRMFKASEKSSQGNRRLFAFQHVISELTSRLTAYLKGVRRLSRSAWPLAGCYLLANGFKNPDTTAFGGKIISRLTELPVHAQWSEESIRADQAARYAAWWTYAASLFVGSLTLSLFLLS